MHITRQAHYAVQAVLYLARSGFDHPISVSQIASEQRLPLPFLSKTCQKLTRAGVLQTSRGFGGGVFLARPPGEISLLEVIEAIDGPIVLSRPIAGSGLEPVGDASDASVANPSQALWYDVQAKLAGVLTDVNFGDLAAQAS